MASTAEYWRDLALTKRIQASRMKDPLAKAAMVRLSNHYAELAKEAEGSGGLAPTRLRLNAPFPDAELPAVVMNALLPVKDAP
ncbi:MAG: hypothetical protein JOZ94_13070 [Xanthobacteraceae bacterium]|nr:hypothetical protein [Xanthobacteraceae bacterium]MBV9628844.1 hypothetical protein [Xanthobacteraceae bacterium]